MFCFCCMPYYYGPYVTSPLPYWNSGEINRNSMQIHPEFDLYEVNRNVRCTNCGHRGAIQSFGKWYPNGLGDKVGDSEILAPLRDKPYMGSTVGFGGTIPYECTNCGNIGLIDIGGLEGYKEAFTTI